MYCSGHTGDVGFRRDFVIMPLPEIDTEKLRAKPYMLIPTRFIPKSFDAITLWPLILIRPECLHNTALIEHEIVHYREQAWIAPVWWLRYLLSRKFRLAAEVRAYRRQIELGGITQAQAALMLTQYRLGITHVQAFQSLTSND